MIASIRNAAALAALVLLLLVPAARAGTPATVTVRVLGPAPAYEALTPPRQVTTNATPVTKDGGSCSGTSAAGALELGTAGDWEGNWSTKFNDYEVIAIDGHSYPFEEGAPANHYWSFWHNNVFAEVGICEAELAAGDQVLFVPACFGTSCPPEPAQLLGVETPAAAEVGKPVALAVRAYPTAGGSSVPAAGVTVTGGGAGGQTDAEGKLTLTFAQAGTFTLRASGTGPEPRPIPGEANVCVHNGNDGTCGTSVPPEHSQGGPELIGSRPGPVPAIEAVRAGGVQNGHVYARGAAPRVLSGSVTVTPGATLREVRFSLERVHHGHCFAFNGRRAVFVRSRCDAARLVRVAQTSSFSYLLPARLRPGRYVYVVQASGDAGPGTQPTVSTRRVVFYVK
jgi:hypothetical protein